MQCHIGALVGQTRTPSGPARGPPMGERGAWAFDFLRRGVALARAGIVLRALLTPQPHESEDGGDNRAYDRQLLHVVPPARRAISDFYTIDSTSGHVKFRRVRRNIKDYVRRPRRGRDAGIDFERTPQPTTGLCATCRRSLAAPATALVRRPHEVRPRSSRPWRGSREGVTSRDPQLPELRTA